MAARTSASRREILKMAGAGSVGLALPLAIVGGVAASRKTAVRSVARGRTVGAATKPPPVTGAQPADPVMTAQAQADEARAWLRDLVGKDLGTYRVESVGALHRGGIPVEMKASSGARFRVDVLRFDAAEGAGGIGELSSVTVYLCNGGKGRKATDEELGLGAMALANELARREREGVAPPRGLLTMSGRAAVDASVT